MDVDSWGDVRGVSSDNTAADSTHISFEMAQYLQVKIPQKYWEYVTHILQSIPGHFKLVLP